MLEEPSGTPVVSLAHVYVSVNVSASASNDEPVHMTTCDVEACVESSVRESIVGAVF